MALRAPLWLTSRVETQNFLVQGFDKDAMMDRRAMPRLTESVRSSDRLKHLAARESGQCYSKHGAHPVRNCVSRNGG